MSYRLLCSLTALICCTLALSLLLVPGLIHWLFGLDMVAESALMARRAGFLFVGLASLYWAIRGLPAGDARNSVASGSIFMLLGLALLGSWELVFGIAGAGILLAISTELVLTFLFVRVFLKDRKAVPEALGAQGSEAS